MKINYAKLSFAIGICLGIGFIGSLATTPAIPTWYGALNKPIFTPPNWLFGPVWTLLYIFMGVSLYLILSEIKQDTRLALNIFGVQLFLNLLWSYLFFGLHNPLLGLICIILLLAMIIYTMILFSKINRTATGLLVPYVLWVGFATILNYAIFVLN